MTKEEVAISNSIWSYFMDPFYAQKQYAKIENIEEWLKKPLVEQMMEKCGKNKRGS